MMKGIVVKFDKARGFGFIRSKQNAGDIFVHITSVREHQTLLPGQKVEFKAKKTEKGLSATNVIPGPMQRSPYIVYGVVSVLIILALTVFLSRKQPLILAYFYSINIVTVVFFGYDKLISGSSIRRIPEWLLHCLAIAGGSLSGIIAQLIFRHKTSKERFQTVYWSIVGVQAILIFLLLKN